MATPDPRDWLVPFTWHGVDNDNKPARGKLVCTARALQITAPDDTDPIRVYTSPQTFDIIDGVCEGELLASDYPNNSNQHYTWYIQELITNGSGMSYDAEIPISMQSTGILLSNYAPTTPSSGLPASMVTRAEFDALARRVDDLQGVSQGDGDVVRMTFDDGVEGSLLVVGGDVFNVLGKPRYASAASKYSFGKGLALNGPVGDYGNFSVISPNVTASDWQIYFILKTIGPKTMTFANFQNALLGSDPLPYLNIRNSKMLVLQSPDTDQWDDVALGTQFPQNQWIRLDIRLENDGTNNNYTISAYWTDPEGVIADAALGASFPGPTIDRIKWGTGSADATWNLNLDTLSYKAGVTDPIPPWQPSLPVWDHQFEADSDRVMAPGDKGLEDAVAAVACSCLVAAKKHGTRGLQTINGYVEYPIRNTAGITSSAYFRRVTSGSNQSALVAFMNGSTLVASIRMKTAGTPGNFTIQNSAGSTVATCTVGIPSNQWWRMDWSHVWTPAAGGTLVITARLNYPAAEAGEGTTYDTFTATITGVAQAPTSTRIGFQDTTGGTWQGYLDSHRSNPNTTDLTTWGPVAPAALQEYKYALTGFTGPTTAEVKAQVSGYATMNLGWSTTKAADGTPNGTITYLGNKTPDAQGLMKWDITGLSPGVPRYYRLSTDGAGSWLGDPMIITPRPASNTAFSNWKITYMSCQRASNEGEEGSNPFVAGVGFYEPTWIDSMAWGANELWFTGDGGYWGSKNDPKDTPATISARWVDWLRGMPKQRAACALAPSRWMKDDHEVVPANKDSNVDPGRSTAEKLHNTEAGMPAIFPFYPLKGAVQSDSYGTFRQSLFGWEMFTSRIRIVYLDTYCMQRSGWAMANTAGAGFGSASNGTEKTWLGVEQDKLLEALLTTGTQPPLTIFCVPKTFLGRLAASGNIVMNDQDKIWNYEAWRQWFGGLVDAHLPNAIWLGGDRHANAYAPASMNPWCNMPCYIGSPTCMHNLGPMRNELGVKAGSTEGYTLVDQPNFKLDLKPDPAKPGQMITYQKTLMCYMRFTISDDNAGHITFTGRSRYHPNTWDGVTPSEESELWPDWMDDPLLDGFTATDVFSY